LKKKKVLLVDRIAKQGAKVDIWFKLLAFLILLI